MTRITYLDCLKPSLLFVLILLAAMLRALPAPAAGTETLTVAGGCFWCVESDFESVPGVIGAVSGGAFKVEATVGARGGVGVSLSGRSGSGGVRSVELTSIRSKSGNAPPSGTPTGSPFSVVESGT